jgi:cytochrome P450
MEQLTFYCTCLFLALLPLAARKLTKKRAGSDDGLRLPPGPWQLPVVGSLHHLLLRNRSLPHRAMAGIARRLGAPPLIYLRLGEIPVVVASSRDASRAFLKEQDANFASRPWSSTVRTMMVDGQGLLFARHGALWRQMRKITVHELLSARRVHSFRRVREEEVRGLVASLAEAAGGEAAVNVSERVAMLVTDSVMRVMIGDRFERREEFLEGLDEAIKITSGFNLSDMFPSSRLARLIGGTGRRAEANHRKNFELMDYAIKQHQQRRAAMAAATDGAGEEEEDLVDVLLRVQKEGGLEVPLTMGIIKAVILVSNHDLTHTLFSPHSTQDP